MTRLDLYGDLNCDGQVDEGDVGAFNLALTQGPAAYAAAYPGCQYLLGDFDADGVVDADDSELFTALLPAGLSGARRFEYDEENRLTRVTRVDGTSEGETLLEIRYDALGRRVETVDPQAANPWGEAEPVRTRHVYAGLETAAEYVWQQSATSYRLAREFVWGERYPEPLAMVDYTALGDKPAGSPGDPVAQPPVPPVNEEVLHFVHDALGSVVGLTDAGAPNAGEPPGSDPIPAKLVERYDYDPYGRTYVSMRAQRRNTTRSWARTRWPRVRRAAMARLLTSGTR